MAGEERIFMQKVPLVILKYPDFCPAFRNFHEDIFYFPVKEDRKEEEKNSKLCFMGGKTKGQSPRAFWAIHLLCCNKSDFRHRIMLHRNTANFCWLSRILLEPSPPP